MVIEGIEGKNRNRHTLRRCRGSVQPSTTENAISRPLGVSALCAWVCTGLCFCLCPARYLLDFVVLPRKLSGLKIGNIGECGCPNMKMICGMDL